MLSCSSCQRVILRDNAKFCPHCGAPVEVGQVNSPVENGSVNQNLEKILGERRLAELLHCIRNSRFDQLRDLLKEVRPQLLSALTQVLNASSYKEMLPPRSSIRIGDPDRFGEAKRLIMSAEVSQQEEGLALFEKAKAEITNPRFVRRVREWWLFASARAKGPPRSVVEWEEDRARGRASWEVIWNLAVFYVHTRHIEQAFGVLRPGVDALRAPFAHLYFALYCATQILAQEQSFSKESRDSACTFLLDHLKKLPLLECLLTWALLVNERPETVELLEQLRVLGTLQDILHQPVSIPGTVGQISRETIETIKKDLERLRLEETWLLWINDYAERNQYYLWAWQRLSEACERVDDTTRTKEALLRLARIALDRYQDQSRKNEPSANRSAPLRGNLIRLFDFYRRKGLLQNEEAEETFREYYTAVPELWSEADSANSRLRHLTSQFLEEIIESSQLIDKLQAVQAIRELKNVQSRVSKALDRFAEKHQRTRNRTEALKRVLNELCAFDTASLNQEDFLHKVDNLNSSFQEVSKLSEQESVPRLFKRLVEAFQRVFKTFAAKLEVAPIPLGAGIPDDLADTALVVRITNHGPGEVTNLRVSCTDKGIITSRREGILDRVQQGETMLVAVPVTVRLATETRQIECQIHLNYQWGTLNDITSSHELRVRRFAFHDFLQQRHISGDRIPNPYVINGPIDFAKHNSRLFQGREGPLDTVEVAFFRRPLLDTPLYFYGIPKVGKTSLLNRIASKLKEGPFLPCLVDLRGINAANQSPDVTINALTSYILRDLTRQGLDTQGINPVPVGQSNPVLKIESFFRVLRTRTNNLQFVLLFDEFPLLVTERTVDLLDFLHFIHQSGLVFFLMSGSLHPEGLRRACPETQLFPLKGQKIDFLSEAAVGRVLREPLDDYGIVLPAATIQRVFIQTAGNPYHVAKIAHYGVIRLNDEHRTVLAPVDIDEIAAKLAGESANFTVSCFSPRLLTSEEQKAALDFVKELNDHDDSLLAAQAFKLFRPAVIQELEKKYILERVPESQEERWRIRGRMLATFLRNRLPPLPPPSPRNRKVGIFVDYENIESLVLEDMKTEDVGKALVSSASTYGRVVCQWVCADLRNIADVPRMRESMKRAGFELASPRGEPPRGRPQSNITDFVLIERINDESTRTKPDIYIIVSGDGHYYDKIESLLRDNKIVHLWASKERLSAKYRYLEEQRRSYQTANGRSEADFFIEDLDEIL